MNHSSVSPLSQSTRVLIVGGGLAGLSAAMFLAWRGLPTLLIEKHPGSALHPRAMGFTTRTLELFRAVGLGARIPQVPVGHGRPRRVSVESLAGKWSTEVAWTPTEESTAPSKTQKRDPSPCTGAAIAQDRLEPILREHAVELGADVRLNTELVSLEQSANGVVALVRQRDGHSYTVNADYVIAADGHASPIREALGIPRSGHGFLQVVRSVLFRAELDEYLASGVSQFEIDQPSLKGMLTTYRDGRWLLMFTDDQERDETTLKSQVAQAVGKPDLKFEIITTGRWVLSALIADSFAAGRVFLVGDAAHTLPPARGGYGANTGIEDAFNLAWKLASVVSGVSSPELLDSYDAERRPIAWLRHDQIFARRDYAKWATDSERAVAIVEDEAMELGQLYRSNAILGAGTELPPALRPEQWAGQPGTRAPHLWVSSGDAQVSTLDILQRDWVLVSENEHWWHAAARVAEHSRITLHCLRIGGGGGDFGTPITPPVLGPNKLTLDTPLEQIASLPAGKAILDTELPMVISHPQYTSFKSMSLRQLQPVSDGKLTNAALAKTESLLAAVTCHAVATDATTFQRDVRSAFGLGSAGACLVRPDGYVAWRTQELPVDPASELSAMLTHVACAVHS